jgi:hypothetical protein
MPLKLKRKKQKRQETSVSFFASKQNKNSEAKRQKAEKWVRLFRESKRKGS